MTAINSPNIRRYGPAAGRDFVVGDIHGAFDLLEKALDRARFDPARDRLFCVGDLIDRGPRSRDCLSFLSQPWVHSVRGNHEQMVLDLYEHGAPSDYDLWQSARWTGMDWWLECSPQEQDAFLRQFAALPFVMELESEDGLTGFIHAEVPEGMAWNAFVAAIAAGDDPVVQTAIWGRSRIYRQNSEVIAGVSRLFVGHTPQFGGIARLGNGTYMDTGAVFAQIGQNSKGTLTLLELSSTGSSYVVSPFD